MYFLKYSKCSTSNAHKINENTQKLLIFFQEPCDVDDIGSNESGSDEISEEKTRKLKKQKKKEKKTTEKQR